MKKIQIRIMPDGTVHSRTVNIKGKACDKYKGIVENLVDGKVIHAKHTPEYYETVNVNESEIEEESYSTAEEVLYE